MGLDEGLKEVGQFGRYQLRCYLLLIFPLAFSAYYSISYVFTAADLTYRCYVPECESTGSPYSASWLKKAIPYVNDKPASCLRYEPSSNSSCSDFLHNETLRCDKYVFATEQTSIVTSFGIYCDDNKWKLTIVGTLNNVGQFIGLPLAGFVSDRYGRKFMIVWSLILSTIVGTIKSFSPNYYFFLLLESLDAIVGDGIYSGGFILGAEYSSPERRVDVISVLSSSYSLGEVFLGLAAWAATDWRTLLRIIYPPGILFIAYFWLLPESMRWLITKGRKQEALEIFENIEETNNTYISKSTKASLFDEEDESNVNGLEMKKEQENVSPVKEICKSTQMLIRVIICSYVWITHTIVFYGLSLSSVSVNGNPYVNFILVSLAEIPGYIMAAIVMKSAGRRITLASCLALSATSCLIFPFLPSGYETAGLCVYFSGKCFITASFTILYMFTTEMFPTNLRHSLLGICSMFGRIGSMAAPQAPLMAAYVNPLIVFGVMAYIAAVLSLFFPETANKKLPDSVSEAQNIGEINKALVTSTKVLDTIETDHY